MIPRLRLGFRQRPHTPAERLNFNVGTARKRVGKLRYMHRNPVKRGLVLEPEQWGWSSFRQYAFAEPGPVVVNEQRPAELKIRRALGKTVKLSG